MQTLASILNLNGALEYVSNSVRLAFEKGFNDLNLKDEQNSKFFLEAFAKQFSYEQDAIRPKLLAALIKNYNTNPVSSYCLARAFVWLTVPVILGRYSNKMAYNVGNPEALIDQINLEFGSAFCDSLANEHAQLVSSKDFDMEKLVDSLSPEVISHWYDQQQDCATSNGNCEFSEIMAVLWLTTPEKIGKNPSLLSSVSDKKTNSLVDKLVEAVVRHPFY